MSPSLCKRVQGNHLERVTFTIKKKKKNIEKYFFIF